MKRSTKILIFYRTRRSVNCNYPRHESEFASRSVQAGGVGSKYQDYWAGRLPHIQAQLHLAAAEGRAVVRLPGLTRLGTRQSWHGVAEVRAQEMTYSSMAHATSLARRLRPAPCAGSGQNRRTSGSPSTPAVTC